MHNVVKVVLLACSILMLASSGAAKGTQKEPRKNYVKAVEETVDEYGNRKIVSVDSDAVPLNLVEVKPTFQGQDLNAFSRWVATRLVYPQKAKAKGVRGRVNLWFVVDTDGSVVDVLVLGGDPSLGKEAARVVESAPKFQPGKNGGVNVPVAVNFPVIFAVR